MVLKKLPGSEQMIEPIIRLRELEKEDYKIIFNFQRDHESNIMAAFVSKDPNDWNEFKKKWDRISAQKNTIVKIILFQDETAGYIAKYQMLDQPNIGYWIGKKYWGKGIGQLALKRFLAIVKDRPLFARVAFDNIASIKILEKCGFNKIGEDRYFANARMKEITEYIYELSN